MELRVLGPVELAAEGQRVSLGSDRQRAVLAALLARPGETVATDQLLDVVWDGDPPASARQSLHSHVSRLRGTLAALAGEGLVVTATGGYRLDLGRHGLDARRFDALLDRSAAEGARDPRRAVALLDEALALWRGPAFGDLATRDALRAAATRLDQRRATAVADRIDAVLALGGHAHVLGDIEATVHDDPLAERPHGQLMLALYRCGHQSDALATYRTLHRRLREDVGVDPSPDLQRLHERILRQDPDLVVASHAPGPSVAPSLPAASTEGLLGRDDDIVVLAEMLRTSPLVTLTGPGGVGKTRLAGAVAEHVVDAFPDGVTSCELAAVTDPSSVASAAAGALGIPHPGDRSAGETVVAALGTRRLLLVLDDCEHVLAAVSDLVDAVRRQCPSVAVLATSRERLHLPGERVWEVPPLDVPPAGATAAAVAATSAGALFLARVRDVDPRFSLSAANAGAVAEICRRLDGIPLAIELAAARSRAFAPSALADRLTHRFRLLTGGPPGAGGRHRTLQTVMDWSYDLLTASDARLFDRLSVFAGSFSLSAAEQVCADARIQRADVAGLLAELIDKSMVATDRGGDEVRYRLLDTMHAYAHARLESLGAAERFRAAHARHHVELVEALAPAVRGAGDRAAVGAIDREIDNLRAAHARLVDAVDVDLALRLPVALHDYVHYRLRDEVVTWTRRALALPGARQHPAFGAALATDARGSLHRGELDRARRSADAALASTAPDSLAALWALHVLTEVALYEGRLDDAAALAERRTDLSVQLGQDYYRAIAGVSRMLALLYRGAAGEALAHADDARRAAESCGNHTARAWVLYAHGETLLDTDPDQAAGLLAQAIDAAGHIGSCLAEGVALVSLASLQGRRGEHRAALELFARAVAHWRRIGDHTHQVTTLRNLVALLAEVAPDDDTALLHGAVTTSAAPSFGTEAERLDVAWDKVAGRLGAARAEAAAERGRRLGLAQAVDVALARLDALGVSGRSW